MAASNADDLPLDEVKFLQHSMRLRTAAFCAPGAMKLMQEEGSKLLRDDAPGKLVEHQIEDLCLMKGQEGKDEASCKFFDGPRGGLLCEIAGAGKTIIMLLHAQMSKPDGPTFVLASKLLIRDVWEPQIIAWLKTPSYVSCLTAKDVEAHLSNHESSNAQFVFLNVDALVKEPTLWPKLKGLMPAYIFVDEGTFLRSYDPQKNEQTQSTKRSMIEDMKQPNTLTWVISAMPFHAKDKDAFATHFSAEAPAYDSITQPRTKYQTDKRRTDKSKGLFAVLSDYFGGKTSAESKDLEVHARKFNFIVRHSPSDIERLMPKLKWVEKEYADEDERKRKFKKIIDATWDSHKKLLVAGMSEGQRKEVAELLKAEGVQHVNLKEQKDAMAAVNKFVSDESVQVALMTENVKIGVDSLKKAQTIVFWSDKHEDFTNIECQTTIIKRICRLGCSHKWVDVVYFHEEAEAARPRKRPRQSLGESPAQA